MKFLLIAFALMGLAAAATLPDSATQGPNPQDIATPEPEYIDIDYPETVPASNPAPAAKSAPQAFSAPVTTLNQYQPQTSYGPPATQHIPHIQYAQPQYGAPETQHIPHIQYAQPQYTQPQYTQPQYTQPQYTLPQELPGHSFSQSGYQYRRPVYIRRVYRH